MTDMTPEKVQAALVLADGNISEAARRLEVSRVTVYKWMRQYNIRRTVGIERPTAA